MHELCLICLKIKLIFFILKIFILIPDLFFFPHFSIARLLVIILPFPLPIPNLIIIHRNINHLFIIIPLPMINWFITTIFLLIYSIRTRSPYNRNNEASSHLDLGPAVPAVHLVVRVTSMLM